MAGSSRARAARQVPTETGDWREKIMANLKTHAGLSEEDIHGSKFALVASSYVQEHGIGPSGMLFAPGEKYYQPNGSEYTLQDVPLQAIVGSVKSRLCGRTTSGGIAPSRRKDIFDKIMADLPAAFKSEAIWEDEPAPLNPNAEPTTSFSAPKTDRLGPTKCNATLINDLARAAGLKPDEALAVRGQITWFDAMAGGFCSISGWKVNGGRLGRDHTLDDVPTCFVRDRVMDYINDQLPEEKRTAVRRAVFSDLTEAEINLYSKLIADERTEADEPPPGASVHLDRQEELLRAIDHTVELTPGPLVIRRSIMPLSRSVVQPGRSDPLPAERLDELDADIHHDCDQIRAMIKLFIGTGEWTMDEFRLALGGVLSGVTRGQLNTFLAHRGPRNGLRCKAFQLCWEFFHRREKLSLPLSGAEPTRDQRLLQRRAAGRRATKRSSTGGGAGGSRGRKRRKRNSTEEGA